MSSVYANVYICFKYLNFFFLLYLNLSYESSSQNRRITWSLSFCWFRHAQSATRKYLDELRGSRQILQLHRWQLHTLGPCNVIMWDETSWDPLLMKTVCWFARAANCTWFFFFEGVPGLVWKTRLWILNVWVQYLGCQFSVYATKEDSFSFEKVKQE